MRNLHKLPTLIPQNKMRPVFGLLIFALAVVITIELTPPPGSPTPAGLPNPIVSAPSTVAENIKLASKDWKNYKGCDDTCLSRCLEKPKDFDMKCSVLFSNATLVKSPTADICRKTDVVRDCKYQCLCACKRCGFCKQELFNGCSDAKMPRECINNVLDQFEVFTKEVLGAFKATSE